VHEQAHVLGLDRGDRRVGGEALPDQYAAMVCAFTELDVGRVLAVLLQEADLLLGIPQLRPASAAERSTRVRRTAEPHSGRRVRSATSRHAARKLPAFRLEPAMPSDRCGDDRVHPGRRGDAGLTGTLGGLEVQLLQILADHVRGDALPRTSVR
jgi:hypothetical protein